MNLIRREPTLLLTLLKALLVAGVAFGLPLSDGQTEALLAVAGAVLALGAVNRQVVTPVLGLGKDLLGGGDRVS